MRNNGITFSSDVLVKTILILACITSIVYFLFPDTNIDNMGNSSNILMASLNINKIKDNGSADAYQELKDQYYNTLKEIDLNTPTDLSSRLSQNIDNKLYKAMSIDYFAAVSNSADNYKIPKWILIGYNSITMGGLEVKNPPIPKTAIPLKAYGTDNNYDTKKNNNSSNEYEQIENKTKENGQEIHREIKIDDNDTSLMASILRQQKLKSSNGSNSQKIINKNVDTKNYLTFYNINTKELINKTEKMQYPSVIGIPEDIYNKYGVDGNNDNVVDKYNLYDSMNTLANYINTNKDKISGYVKLNANFSEKEDIYLNKDLWILTLLHNFIEDDKENWIKYIVSKNYCFGNKLKSIDNNSIYSHYLDGNLNSVEEEVYNFLINNGWKLNNSAMQELIDKGIIIDNKNNRITTTDYSSTPMFMFTEDDFSIKVPTSKLITAIEIYSIGNSIQKELNYRLMNENNTNESLSQVLNKNIKSYRETLEDINVINNFTVPLGFNKVKYYWQTDNPISDTIQRRKTEGAYGEVGYKGSFPIFIQQTGFNRVSTNKWKFNGGTTTIGKAGCSLLSATSLIHGAGYDNYNIPGTNYKPTVENMIKVFPNGPIIGNYISSQGYNVKFRSTRTKKDLDILFQDLKAGIPYVINTKAGSITGYKADGTPVKTEFTYGGHFILMVSGFESNGRRFVEVVQSTRGNAGTKDFDQNQMSFDFDELIKKGILRSSQGYAVPAYTITGGPGLPVPKYLRPDYKNPYTNQESKITEVSQNDIASDEVILRRNQISKSGDSLKKVQHILKQLKISADQITTENNKPDSGIQITNKETNLLGVYEENSDKTQNLLIFVDYNNAIQITHLIKTTNKSGKMEVNTMIGQTTELSRVNFVVRVAGDDWMILKSSDINVTDN